MRVRDWFVERASFSSERGCDLDSTCAPRRKPEDRPDPQGSAVRALLPGRVEGDRDARRRDRSPRGQGDDARGRTGSRVLRPARGNGRRQEEKPESERPRAGRLLRRDRARLARAEDSDGDRDFSGARPGDHRSFVQTLARGIAPGPDQGDGGDGTAPRPEDALAAAAEHGTEPVGQGVGDLLAERCRVRVRERPLRRPERDAEPDRLLSFADLLAAVNGEDLDPAQLGAGRLARRVDELTGFDLLRDDECKVLPDRRVGDHVLVGDRLARLREQRVEVELEPAPFAGEDAGIDLAEHTGGGPGRLAGVQEGVLAALESRLGLEGLVERLDDTFYAREAALGDRGDM